MAKVAMGLALALGLTSFILSQESPTYYLNLREPIYFVVDPSFSTGCDGDTDVCVKKRLDVFRAGLDDWFKHFPKRFRPKTIIVFSPEEMPLRAVNFPISLQIKENGCVLGVPPTKYFGCYLTDSGSPRIIFNDPGQITTPTSAHEFGHALGLNHRDTYSIMSWGKGNKVLPIDMNDLCNLHQECPPHDETWCEGTFYDSCRCPSESFEASEESKRVCE